MRTSDVFCVAAICTSLMAAGLPSPAWAADLPSPATEAALYANAKAEGTVVWYESVPLEAAQSLVSSFEKRYPGVKVDIVRIVGLALYQRFVQETEAKQYIVDVIGQPDQVSMADIIKRGDVADWKIPTFDRLPPTARMETFAYTPYSNDSVIVYNTSKVSDDEVKLLASGWKSILDPRFKQRFGVTTTRCAGCYAPISMFLDPKNKDQYSDTMITQIAAQKPGIYSDVTVLLNAVVSGEKDIAYWTAENVAFFKWSQGAPIRWVRPKPSPILGGDWSAISKSAPHPNAARLFEDWLFSDEGAIAFQNVYAANTNLIGVPDQRAVAKEAWYPHITERYFPDPSRWAANYTKDMNLWEKTLKAAQ